MEKNEEYYRKCLDYLGWQAEKHWKQFRPKMYRELKKKGVLYKSLYAAQERTEDALADLIEKGLSYDMAWEAVREEWLFLPTEKDLPVLGFNPENLEPPNREEKE